MIKVLFICMGNICRSPTAEGVFRKRVEGLGWNAHIQIDSAGTHDYHVGNPPDQRAQQAAKTRGYDLAKLRGRQVSPQDFQEFDFILAMDAENLARLQRQCPDQHAHKLGLFMQYSRNYLEREVPDPYYGNTDGFERVLDMVEDASEGLIEHLKRTKKQQLP